MHFQLLETLLAFGSACQSCGTEPDVNGKIEGFVEMRGVPLLEWESIALNYFLMANRLGIAGSR